MRTRTHAVPRTHAQAKFPGLKIVGPRADQDRIPGIDEAYADGDAFSFGALEVQVGVALHCVCCMFVRAAGSGGTGGLAGRVRWWAGREGALVGGQTGGALQGAASSSDLA